MSVATVARSNNNNNGAVHDGSGHRSAILASSRRCPPPFFLNKRVFRRCLMYHQNEQGDGEDPHHRVLLQTTMEEDDHDMSRNNKNNRNDKTTNDGDFNYHRMIMLHKEMTERINDINQQTIIPFARGCQERLTKLGGFPMDFSKETTQQSTDDVDRKLILLEEGQAPVTVLDQVVPAEWCRSLIDLTESIGYASAPSLQDVLYAAASTQDNRSSRSKNTSQLVQLESPEFAEFLWKQVKTFVPDRQSRIAQKGLLKPILGGAAGVYEKRGIIPIFRFMRYKPSQGFKVHEDPERLYSKYPLRGGGGGSSSDSKGFEYDDGDDTTTIKHTTQYGDAGIFRSLFTIAIYLNDAASEFEGGELNFVKPDYSPLHQLENHNRNEEYYHYESLATVAPAVGRCVLFRHDALHEGGGVRDGTKYMIQCDVLYECVNLTGSE